MSCLGISLLELTFEVVNVLLYHLLVVSVVGGLDVSLGADFAALLSHT